MMTCMLGFAALSLVISAGVLNMISYCWVLLECNGCVKTGPLYDTAVFSTLIYTVYITFLLHRMHYIHKTKFVNVQYRHYLVITPCRHLEYEQSRDLVRRTKRFNLKSTAWHSLQFVLAFSVYQLAVISCKDIEQYYRQCKPLYTVSITACQCQRSITCHGISFIWIELYLSKFDQLL